MAHAHSSTDEDAGVDRRPPSRNRRKLRRGLTKRQLQRVEQHEQQPSKPLSKAANRRAKRAKQAADEDHQPGQRADVRPLPDIPGARWI
uniref:Uncharacterized protein n=1 Tax=Eutreptiella gymnastica TaxID=73025 RepID=A0A7S1NUW7_9EUGL